MRNSFLCLFVFAVANMGAQNNMADILASIETNNPELKAGVRAFMGSRQCQRPQVRYFGFPVVRFSFAICSAE